MNNLLQSLSSQRLKLKVPEGDLKRLLSTVKEGRGHDAKLSDAFYDSLEGVLNDLRTITSDNHDAEAFLKPVPRTDYPDYYDIIHTPMDLQTMLKKVKQKQYKSKSEFADDLQLIWENCFNYNNGENHPLRLCATRLREKANRLLSAITDRRDRLDPPVPSVAGVLHAPTPKVNGVIHLNGTTPGHSRKRSSPPLARAKSRADSVASSRTPTLVPPPTAGTSVRLPMKELTLQDMPAYERTAQGMAEFLALDAELDRNLGICSSSGPKEGEPGPSRITLHPASSSSSSSSFPTFMRMSNGSNYGLGAPSLADRLTGYVEGVTSDDETSGEAVNGIVNGIVGEKRKLAINGDVHPRKRPRLRQSNHFGRDLALDDQQYLDLWWEASRSPGLMANGLPILKYPTSIACEASYQPRASTSRPATLPSTSAMPSSETAIQPTGKRKGRRRKKKEPPEQTKSLLALINANIRSQRRVRRTHDKFLALNLNSNNEDGSGSGFGPMGSVEPPDVGPEDDDVDMVIDERPWLSRGTGLEVGEQDASECLRWTGMKIVEHAGFQSTSRAALDVLTGVMAEYILNVGRTIRYLCDKYSRSMTSEEIILHTLFESGITHVHNLERYIKDDVIRYGARLTELEKKLVGAYREVTAVDAIDDDALFGNEDDEEADSEFVMGNFADAFGEDFLGLRETGIANEFGLQSLSIPKKLLKGKRNGLLRGAQDRAKPTEPPPPYPPPPAFVPLDSKSVDHHIGLLRNFYMDRFNSLAASSVPPMPPPFIRPPPQQNGLQPPERPLSPNSQLQMSLEAQLLGVSAPPEMQNSIGIAAYSLGSSGGVQSYGGAPMTVPSAPGGPPPPPVSNPAAPILFLPDDSPAPNRTKIGPLGTIIRPATAATGTTKKKKSGGSAGASGGGGTAPVAGPGPVMTAPTLPATAGAGAGVGMFAGQYPGIVTPAPGPAPGYYQGIIQPTWSMPGPGGAMTASAEAGGGATGGETKKKGGGKKKADAPMPPVIVASA